MGNSHSSLEYREPIGRNRTINRLRRSIRASFHKKKRENNKWHEDELSVRNSFSSFPVKYLGCVQVFESRGMQICEDALEELRKSRKHPIRAVLHVGGDGIRVIEDETKGLLVDQTIEKVSFCAPDRNHERGFSYICRDGATRRWMCYGFHAIGDSGERLSHAVGCAFTVCLEKKMNREKSVTAIAAAEPSSFVRTGSFKQTTLTERLNDPQQCKPAEPPPVKPIQNPHAVERPHATTSMLQRQASCRRLGKLDRASPFKRQLSLRISDLPSTQARQQSMLTETFSQPIVELSPMSEFPDTIKQIDNELQVYKNESFLTKSVENVNGNIPATLNINEQVTIPNSNRQLYSETKDKSLNKNETSKTLFELALAAQKTTNEVESSGDFDLQWIALDNSKKTFKVQM